MPEPKTPNQNFPRLTMQQAKEEMACFQKIYPLVRLVDLKTLATQPCYAPWKGRAPCRNCIGREALNCKGKKSKIEYLGTKAYQATAIYVEVDGVPYVFDIMKTHTLIGAAMPDNLDLYRDEPLVKIAYQICRWHHERYDGKGYPDGLVGDQIPISAQVVSLADVYDALTSKRVYKDAYPHKKAIQMIMNGECGVFNPLLLECLLDVESRIQVAMNTLPAPR